jgi:hypothetical protein
MRRLLLLALANCGGGHDATVDAAPPDVASVDDGTPMRQACTSLFGDKLSASDTFGRLDGYLVAIVAPSGMNSCNADSSHVHLQVKMMGSVYDVAIDATDGTTGIDDVHTTTIEHALPDTPWVEGWHTGLLADYVTLGVHSTDMPLQTKQQVVDTLNTDFATANHVSIYMTTYGPDGGHLVHRNGNGHDGIIITAPLAQPSHLRLLSFTSETF